MFRRIAASCLVVFLFSVFAASTSQPSTEQWLKTLPLPPEDARKARPYLPAVQRHTQTGTISLPLALAVMKAESGFNPKASSDKGALGLMQLMPETAMDEFRKLEIEISPVHLKQQLIEQPNLNILLGIRYLQTLEERFAEIESPKLRRQLVVMAYNAGFRRVKLALGCRGYSCVRDRVNQGGERYLKQAMKNLPMETRSYLLIVKQFHGYYQSWFNDFIADPNRMVWHPENATG